MLNIVIPMAGRGSRFATAGFTLPKPLIQVRGVPMIELVVNNLRPSQAHRFTFLCLEEHLSEFNVASTLRRMAPGCNIVPVRETTEGAACTVLLAKSHINTTDPLMIANSDQWVDVPIDKYLASGQGTDQDGLIMTMRADDPKWSYIRFNDAGGISEVVEKQVVSPEATVGIYNFAHGSDFVNAAEEMIAQDLRVNNEFYVAPCYNQLIDAGKDIGYFNIGSEGDGMYGLGIPSDLELFLNSKVAMRAVA